jgi:hypothetical protein
MRSSTITAPSPTKQRNDVSFSAENPVTAIPSKTAPVVGFAAVIWFVLLSGWLGVTPGSVITKRQNVLFNSDTNLWVDRMIGNAQSPERLVHPLEVLIWRAPCRGIQRLLGVFLPFDYAGLLAARLLVASVAALGVGCLAYLALYLGVKTTHMVLLFTMYLLFTSNTTLSLPEHFGISNGLLCIAFVFPIVVANPELRVAFLAALTVLCGGTTITNVLFPLASFVKYCLKATRAKLYAAATAMAAGLGAALFLYIRSFTIHHFVGKYLSLRWFRDPFEAGIYAIYAFVAPAIGPAPRMLRFPGWDMVSYEPALQPLRLSYYAGFQAIGAVAWVLLLVTCTVKALQDDRTRAFVWLPLGWVLFNIAFHNIWGDELFLYAPHWSWALMALVVLGARGLSTRFLAATSAAVIAGQLFTLFAIKHALQTITF